MSPAELLVQPWSQAVTLALLHFLWQGLLVAVGLAALVELLGIRRPAARYACSLAAFVLLAACPLATLAWQLRPEQLPAISPRSLATRVAAASQLSESVAAPPIAQPLELLGDAQPYVLAAWLAGVAVFASRLLAGLIGLRQLGRHRLALPHELADRVARLAGRLRIRGRPRVFFSLRVGEAMAVGLVRPLVLLPASWATEMPPALLEAVIAHELAHLRRGDLWVNLVQRIVETLLFYHPAVWWLSGRLRAERELCCDQLAVAVTGQRLEYVQSLEHVARRATGARPALAAGIRGERHMQLLKRVRNVLGLSAAPECSLWPAGVLALALPLGVWAYAAGLIPADSAAAVADDDRDDDDDDDGREEVRRKGEREDDDADEKEGREARAERRREREVEREREGDRPREGDRDRPREGDRAREGDRPRDGDDPQAARGKRERIAELKFFGKEDEPRRDGDRPVKEGARDGDRPIKEGPRDGDRPIKEGPRDGDRPIKKGPRDGDRPIRKGPRDGDRPIKEVARDGDRPREDARIAKLMAVVKRLTAENDRLRAELARLSDGAKRSAEPK